MKSEMYQKLCQMTINYRKSTKGVGHPYHWPTSQLDLQPWEDAGWQLDLRYDAAEDIWPQQDKWFSAAPDLAATPQGSMQCTL